MGSGFGGGAGGRGSAGFGRAVAWGRDGGGTVSDGACVGTGTGSTFWAVSGAGVGEAVSAWGSAGLFP
jgi:hypothetical protein